MDATEQRLRQIENRIRELELLIKQLMQKQGAASSAFYQAVPGTGPQ